MGVWMLVFYFNLDVRMSACVSCIARRMYGSEVVCFDREYMACLVQQSMSR